MNAVLEKNALGADKIERYKWRAKDQMGEFRLVHKNNLHIDPDYQRETTQAKVLAIASEFSWIGCGAIVVGERKGVLWVIDGSHRVSAAKHRSDISVLPCIVFKTDSMSDEALAFLLLNTNRKPMSIFSRNKARIAADDPVAVEVSRVLFDLGIEATESKLKPNQLKCIGWCLKRCAEDSARFRRALQLGAEISRADNQGISERILDGLWYLDINLACGITDKKFAARLRDKGSRTLMDAIARSIGFYSRSGSRIWALGILTEVNKGLQNKYQLESGES